MKTISKEASPQVKWILCVRKLWTYEHMNVSMVKSDSPGKCCLRLQVLLIIMLLFDICHTQRDSEKHSQYTHTDEHTAHVHRLRAQRLAIVNNRFGNVLMAALYNIHSPFNPLWLSADLYFVRMAEDTSNGGRSKRKKLYIEVSGRMATENWKKKQRKFMWYLTYKPH